MDDHDELTKLRTVVMGADGNNGLRSRVVNLERACIDIKDTISDIWNNKRREECLGIEALNSHIAQHAVEKREAGEMSKAIMDYKKAIRVQLIATLGMLAATVLVALLK